MTATVTLAKPPAANAKPIAKPAQPKLIAPQRIVPSAPRLFPLSRLHRAEENVRHARYDEDIDALAADIAAHGLLQSLIGYEQPAPGRALSHVMVVGGGRRFQALRQLKEEELIGGDWDVPVLIRAKDEAVELSLAENLQQRTMSPVDEFFAFKTLMDMGRYDAASLAKRFGYTERVVKQRLRLAALHPDVLGALSDRKITLDAAMAYASSQDGGLQRDVFRQHNKAGFFDAQRPDRIKRDLRGKGIDTGNRLFKFVGAAAYEAVGGGYEDDLFSSGTAAEARAERQLSQPHLVEQLAHEQIDRSEAALLRELGARKDLAPTIAGLVRIPGLMLHSWGTQAQLGAPAGFVKVEKHEARGLWATIRNNRLPVHVTVGIDEHGKLLAWPRIVFIEKAQREAVDPQAVASERTIAAYKPETPDEAAARARKAAIERLQRRLAVGTFAGTPFEGRAFWGNHWANRHTLNGELGYLVEVEIFASDAAIAAQTDAATAEYDREVAEREQASAPARQRVAKLLAMPEPAIVVIDGEAWRRRDDGSYWPDGDDGEPWGQWAFFAERSADEIELTFATVEEFDAAVGAAKLEEPA